MKDLGNLTLGAVKDQFCAFALGSKARQGQGHGPMVDGSGWGSRKQMNPNPGLPRSEFRGEPKAGSGQYLAASKGNLDLFGSRGDGPLDPSDQVQGWLEFEELTKCFSAQPGVDRESSPTVGDALVSELLQELVDFGHVLGFPEAGTAPSAGTRSFGGLPRSS